jgi:plastocyanin
MVPRAFVSMGLGAAALVLACVSAACGTGNPGPTGPIDGATLTDTAASAEPEHAMFFLYDNLPEPGQLTVAVGAPVEWKNAGANNHTVTNYSQGFDEWEDVLVEPGESFTHVFQEAGDYGFICIIHQEVGYIAVVEATP